MHIALHLYALFIQNFQPCIDEITQIEIRLRIGAESIGLNMSNWCPERVAEQERPKETNNWKRKWTRHIIHHIPQKSDPEFG